MRQVFLASGNLKKLAELQRILEPLVPGVSVVGIGDVSGYVEPIEDRPDFVGNARLKARAGVAATGLPSLADDSGLCVDALNGMPGVLSARWSGVVGADRAATDLRNNELLLAQLADVPEGRRRAHFACAVVLALPGGGEHVVSGRMDGRILREMRGSGGFGYDVLFVADDTDDGRTSAQLDVEEKDAISHRGRALREIAPLVANALGSTA